MKMPSAECAERFKFKLREALRSMDTFHLSWEAETDRLKGIYTSRIEASAVSHDDWTRVRAVHLNHHLMMLVI